MFLTSLSSIASVNNLTVSLENSSSELPKKTTPVPDSNISKISSIPTYLNELSLEKRLQFTDALFDVLACNANKTLTDIREESWKSVFSMIKSYEQLDKEMKKLLSDVIGMLLTEGIRSIFEEKKPELWTEKLPKLQFTKKKQ